MIINITYDQINCYEDINFWVFDKDVLLQFVQHE